jgi:Cd2+/Zn2+-exporting ATPase
MQKQVYKIRGLDCPNEVAALRHALKPIVSAEDALSFDLLNGRLTVACACAPEAVMAAVRQTGMQAVPWSPETAPQGTDWRAHAPTAACAASALALAGGFVWHAATMGLAAAVTESHLDYASHPVATGLCYAAATFVGLYFVLPRAWFALRNLRPDINLLMVVAVAGAWVIGSWLEAALVSFLFSAALLLESWSVGRARRAIESLMELRPASARVLHGHGGHAHTHDTPVAEVAPGALVRVLPGERVPLDGVLTEGSTSMDQAPITGESRPVDKAAGDPVFAGAINNEGAVTFRVDRPAEDTQLARIIRMVEEAQSRRAPTEQWVDRFARVYTPVMMGVALAVALLPPVLGLMPWLDAAYTALVLLLIACPCALVISTPVSIVAGLAAAARAGVLIKGGAHLEAPARIKVVALDKTGTLTHGRPAVQQVIPINGVDAGELLRIAAAIESLSRHPIAQAIVRHALAAGHDIQPAEAYRALEGRGAEARVGGKRYWIGSHRLLSEAGHAAPELEARVAALEDAAHSIVLLGDDERILGLIGVADAVRDGSAAAVAALRRAGVAHVVMLTGDHAGTARAVAEATGVDAFHADMLPEDKRDAIAALSASHGPVAMVGDGVNDAPAMAAARVSIAMGAAGSDAALETADIALMSDDLARLPWTIAHARRVLRVIQQNIAMALGLKLAVLALALAGFAWLWTAILADMGASLLVIGNSLRLLRADRKK